LPRRIRRGILPRPSDSMSGGAAGYGSYSPSSAVSAKAYACTRSFSYSMTSCAVFVVGNKGAARVLPPLAAPSPRFSAREAVTAALLLRAAHGQHARGHEIGRASCRERE